MLTFTKPSKRINEDFQEPSGYKDTALSFSPSTLKVEHADLPKAATIMHHYTTYGTYQGPVLVSPQGDGYVVVVGGKEEEMDKDTLSSRIKLGVYKNSGPTPEAMALDLASFPIGSCWVFHNTTDKSLDYAACVVEHPDETHAIFDNDEVYRIQTLKSFVEQGYLTEVDPEVGSDNYNRYILNLGDSGVIREKACAVEEDETTEVDIVTEATAELYDEKMYRKNLWFHKRTLRLLREESERRSITITDLIKRIIIAD